MLVGQERADSLYIIQTTLDGSGVKFFLEVDRGTRPFDAGKYLRLYASEWQSRPWADPRGTGKATFPLIVVASLVPERILRAIKKTPLPWRVCNFREAERNLLKVVLG